MFIIFLSSFFCWLAGFWILFRIPICTKSRCRENNKTISVIIPARNEESNLPRLLGSLKRQSTAPHEIIVVDDNSADRTRMVAVEHRVRAVSAGPLPAGWLGKPWAAHRGALTARGDILVFLDADTFLEPDGLEKIICTFLSEPGVISINPYHYMRKPYEYLSAFFNIMQTVGMQVFSLNRKARPSGMFGPSLVITAADYKRTGGYESVKNELLENHALGNIFKNRGLPVRLYRGAGSINVRLYGDGMRNLISGWSKSFGTGAKRTPKQVMRLSAIWMAGLTTVPLLLPASLALDGYIQLSSGPVLYALYVIQVNFHLKRLGNFPFWVSVAYPIPLFFFLYLFVKESMRSKKNETVVWKGRNIRLD